MCVLLRDEDRTQECGDEMIMHAVVDAVRAVQSVQAFVFLRHGKLISGMFPQNSPDAAKPSRSLIRNSLRDGNPHNSNGFLPAAKLRR